MAKKEERGFKYQKRTAEDVKARANMKGGNFDSYIKPKYKQWKPKDGKNLIRILPATWDLEDTPWQEKKHCGLDIYVNFSIGPDNQAYLSLSRHLKGDDPLLEAKREAQRDGEKELAKALNPSQRILYWMIDRNDEEEGPLLWASPFTFDKSLNNLCVDEDTKDVIFIDGEEDGNDVRFYKEGTGLTTKYDPSKMKILAKSFIHEDEDIQQKWLDFIVANPLSDVLNFYDYEHIKTTFDGQAGRKDEDEEAEEKPTNRKRAVKDEEVTPRRRAKPDPEDDETAPRQRGPRRDPDDEELEESPRNRGRAVRDSEDEEPEEKPRRRVRVEPEDDEDPPSTRRTTRPSTDEEEGSGTLRDRIARRRSRSTENDRG